MFGKTFRRATGLLGEHTDRRSSAFDETNLQSSRGFFFRSSEVASGSTLMPYIEGEMMETKRKDEK